MEYSNTNSVNPALLKYLYDITPEELITINSRTQGFGDDELTHFWRRSPDLCLIVTY